jgi:hypothetical protein
MTVRGKQVPTWLSITVAVLGGFGAAKGLGLVDRGWPTKGELAVVEAKADEANRCCEDALREMAEDRKTIIENQQRILRRLDWERNNRSQ